MSHGFSDERRLRAVHTLLALALLVAALTALAVGPVSIAPSKLLAALGVPTGVEPADFERIAVLQIRLPRVLLAILVGAALAIAGAAMQGLLRNPLADPGLMDDFRAKGVVLMRADWTRRDETITQALKELGRSGVPVYALYRKGAQQPTLLSELPSVDEIRRALAAP